MRIRSDSYYVEHGQQSVAPGWAGRWWRLVGMAALSVTWFLYALRWEVAFAIWAGVMAVVIFGAAWYVAGWFDSQEKK